MPNAPQFITDAMLGKLTKWLRVIGMDVIYDPNSTDAQLLRYAERGGRTLLTRDRRLTYRHSPAYLLYIHSNYYYEQVRQVVQAFNLAEKIQVFTRCLRCNAPLQPIAKEVVMARVPSYVYATQMTFKSCATCNRLYWGGTHRDNMLRQLQTMLGELLIIDSETPR
jgi:uncharacterized protein with PIN domain